MKSIITSVLLVFGMAAFATPPEISNVRASQRSGTKLVDIYYNAADVDGDLLKVRVEISDNDGVKYSVPAFSLTGDIGEGVAPGTNKHIVWDAGTDWDGEYSDKMRVKVFAIDAKGFPGMEWSNEVKPGGFLLGQDGGAEGAGESQHVNIKWSYWMTKYEITNAQYCDFLNAAIVAGIIGRNEAASVSATASMPVSYACPLDAILCYIGDDWGIRWNVNNFEVVSGRENLPAITTWYGAMAFCRFYGYDLPTEAEWEKAARGPDYDDQDEHLVYPWDNTCSDSQAWKTYASYYGYGIYTSSSKSSLALTSVSAYDAYAGGYGLCDVVGNAAEWTRSSGEETLGTYPTEESLKIDRQLPFVTVDRIVKGRGADGLYARTAIDPAQWYLSELNYSSRYHLIGFRAVRRDSSAKDVNMTKEVYEDFETLTANALIFSHNGKMWRTDCSDNGDYDGYQMFRMTSGVNNGKGVCGNGYGCRLYLPPLSGSLCLVRLKARNTYSYEAFISCGSSLGSGDYARLPAYMSGFAGFDISVVKDASDYYLYLDSSVSVDEIELWTVPKN